MAPIAFAGPINFTTAINFTCSGQSVAGPGNTSAPPTACTPLTGGYEGLASASPLATWYQQSISPLTNYYTVTSPATKNVNGVNSNNGSFSSNTAQFEYNENQGFNWTSAAPINANGASKIPSLAETGAGATSQIKVTDSTGTFYLNGFYLGESATGTLDYMIYGYNGSTLVYCIDDKSGTLNTCSGTLTSAWDTLGTVTKTGSGAYYTYIVNPDANIAVTSIYIDTNISSSDFQYVDNIIVSQTPEPTSLLLLGSGFAGLAGMLRRRQRA